ncbi:MULTISPECIES: hypothetical protein [Streptomycetaceae]|uniref:Uncharacterized protein n=1 Tax=Streptantibioticus cattleyicolor (strain ATCC 35852 / DSM 46488 / JCM 4925 / NBRC 14057 / NRRL 8057) TaxID=1003195 RepID=F8JT37_STREN|nr:MULTISPECIES: hypothetical protein [Streptomycetaceae]AEW92972.1 hypothetical protein SCATT_06010 [Streptantibioticus cattleyicolor NRRL 8057 = DSM 46488]MYS57715.1 hypothetical protein [Streptomyces sp. SID5468]CCB73333.1 protein of unknown function [Streptantibioticus cattleyicolor NRRL 8057 = DSM 46488]
MPKAPWFPRVTRLAVNWTCADTHTRDYFKGPDAPFSRMVTWTTDLAGRELITVMTPNEARAIAYHLARQADAADQANTTQGDGNCYPDEAKWARYRGVVIPLTTVAASMLLDDINAAALAECTASAPAARLSTAVRSQLSSLHALTRR